MHIQAKPRYSWEIFGSKIYKNNQTKLIFYIQTLYRSLLTLIFPKKIPHRRSTKVCHAIVTKHIVTAKRKGTLTGIRKVKCDAHHLYAEKTWLQSVTYFCPSLSSHRRRRTELLKYNLHTASVQRISRSRK